MKDNEELPSNISENQNQYTFDVHTDLTNTGSSLISNNSTTAVVSDAPLTANGVANHTADMSIPQPNKFEF